MRGKLNRFFFSVPVHGLIPAHAGKTSFSPLSLSGAWAHPRACGENRYLCGGGRSQPGSSPRMRGKPPGPHHPQALERLIPAHAGKTFFGEGALRCGRAHPRACGENHVLMALRSALRGSSPRMRGKLGSSLLQYGSIGLIPAHAGKTCEGVNSLRPARAHPRACGENSLP